ncbi:MAG: hypothetical protein ABI439_07710 [Rhodospirillales bacterium]
MIGSFLNVIESRIRKEEAKFPADKPPLDYANASLVKLEAVRPELAEAAQEQRRLAARHAARRSGG